MTDHLFSEIGIETLEPLRVACYRVVSQTPETDAMNYIKQWLNCQNFASSVRNFGFDIEITPEQQKTGLRGYEVWMNVSLDVRPSDGVTIKHFAGGLYAVLTIYKPFDDPCKRIPAGWKVLHQWVIESDQYRGAYHQWLEEVISLKVGDNLKIYHPITVIT